MDEKVSIIVPVYNCKNYINKCFDSIISQTYKDIEIIAVIDEKDDSNDIIDKYCLNDKRIKKVCRCNINAIKNRVEGIKNATGDYVMFVDSDDWIEVNTIDNLVSKLNEYRESIPNGIDVIKFNYYRENINKSIKNHFDADNLFFEKTNISKLFLNMFSTYNFNQMWGQLIRKSTINLNDLNEDLVMGEDYYFNIKLYEHIDNILVIDEPLYHYRYNKNGTMNQNKYNKQYKYMSDLIYIYDYILEKTKKLNISERNKKSIYLHSVIEISGHALKIFQNKIISKNDKINFINMIINSDFFVNLNSLLTINDVKNCKSKLKHFILTLYKGNMNKIFFIGKLYYVILKSKKLCENNF